MKVLIVGGTRVLQEKILLSRNVHVKYVTCGRPNCLCIIGKKHGPYYYIRRRTNGRYSDKYVSLKNRSGNDFQYETVGEDVVLDVTSLSRIPEDFNECHAFVVKEQLR